MFVWEISSWPKRGHLSVSHFKTYDLPLMHQAYTQEEARESTEQLGLLGLLGLPLSEVAGQTKCECEFYDYTIYNTNKQNVHVTKNQDGREV